MAASSVTVRLNLNSAGYSAEMSKAESQMKRLQAATGEMGIHTVSQMQASSAAIRTLEGGMTNSIRAAERFVSLLPGVGAALQAAFPVVGAIALIGVFARIGEELYKFVQKLNDIPPNPFEKLISSAKLSNDALAITNDRLENEIAKLEHKPQNRMAEALDQMRKSSDALFDSLQKSNAAFDEAMGKKNVSMMQGLWRHEAPTKEADQNIASVRTGVKNVVGYRQQIVDDALKSGNQDDIAQAREAQMIAAQNAYAIMDSNLKYWISQAEAAKSDSTRAYSGGADPSAALEKYVAALNQSQEEQKSIGGQYGSSLLSGQKDNAQDASDQSELAKAAARKQLQAMQDELEQRKAQYGMSIAEERSYWQQREAAFVSGSDAYREVVNKVAALEIQMQRQQSESLKAARAEAASGSRDSSRVLESAAAAVDALMRREGEDVLRTGERWKAYNDAVAKAAEIQAANAEAFDKTRIALELANGQISKLDAAEQMASIHARAFASDLAALQQQRAQIAGDDSLTDVQRKTALQQNSNAQIALQGQAQVQQMGDQSAIADQQLGPAARDALGTMVNQWSNMTTAIVQTMTKTIDSFNDDVVNAMMGKGKAADFGKTFSAAGQGLLKASLQKAEGTVMGAFGLGKPDGTQNNPIWTRNAGSLGVPGLTGGQNQGGQGQSPTGNAIFRPFFGGQQDQNGQNGQGGQGGSIWSNLFNAFLGGKSGQGASDGGGSGAGGGGGGGGYIPQLMQRLSDGGSGGPAFDTTGGSDGGDDIGYQGGFASGGNFVANRPMMVGERGPELLTPGTSGRITPNYKLGGSSSTVHNFNIDARGSSDPAAIHAAVMRAAPHIVAASLQAHHSSARRSPHK